MIDYNWDSDGKQFICGENLKREMEREFDHFLLWYLPMNIESAWIVQLRMYFYNLIVIMGKFCT